MSFILVAKWKLVAINAVFFWDLELGCDCSRHCRCAPGFACGCYVRDYTIGLAEERQEGLHRRRLVRVLVDGYRLRHRPEEDGRMALVVDSRMALVGVHSRRRKVTAGDNHRVGLVQGSRGEEAGSSTDLGVVCHKHARSMPGSCRGHSVAHKAHPVAGVPQI